MHDEGTLSVDDIDLSDVEFWLRPYRERAAAFRMLRHERPISHYDEPDISASAMEFPKGDGYYAVTRYADVAEVTRRPDVFLSGHGSVTMFDLPPEMAEYFSGMISTDNPKHARLRRIVSNAFNPKNVRSIEESIERVASETVTRALESGTGDFVVDIASPYPSEIICLMLGVPKSEYETVVRCASVILSNGDNEIIGEGADPVVALLEAGGTLIGIMEELGTYRRDQPIDDVTSALVNAEIESERLTQQELASFFVLLVTAGSETTRTALSHALHYFGEFPDQQRRLADDFDGLAKTATDEIVRYASPIGWTRRTLASDYTLGGVDLRAGEHVVQFYGSANRDETVFENPEMFDVGRTPNDHFGFGAPGPHFCLGAHLARREITVMWRELLTRTPLIRATNQPVQLASSFVNGIKHLNYRFE
ncbi:MAG TPA: cytochrome P450 [Acidimicrobiales bacterium]|nr:cytochrome P450 [Acidimicrobiales bacterium]